MYARGMTVREIQGHLLELYGLEVSPDLISTVTDAVLETVAEWQNRPLEPMYPLVFSAPGADANEERVQWSWRSCHGPGRLDEHGARVAAPGLADTPMMSGASPDCRTRGFNPR